MVRKVVEVNIREASLSDYKKIAEVHIESWCFTYRKILNIDFLSSFSLKRTSEYWKENITQGLFWIFVVESYYKDLIGYIQICKSKNLSNINRAAEIIAIYISPKALRNRYGTNLFGYSLDFLKGNNFKEVFLWVFENNNIAINFYKKFGFANTDENRISDHNRESKFTEIKLSKSLR
jgi:ribosomal protein S18 acetylase RimI-like enzyme